MPTATRQPGSPRPAVWRSSDETAIGDSHPLEVLLPSGGALPPAPAPAPHRVLALDAIRLRRDLQNGDRHPDSWASPLFAREVGLVRAHLAPLRSRRSLTASFGREAFHSLGGDAGAGVSRAGSTPIGPTRAAYAIRWLELGSGTSLPVWPRLLARETV